MIRLEVEQNGSAVARLYFYAETGRWDWAADEDAFPNLNKHGLNVHEGFTSIAEAWEDLCTVLGLLGKGAGAEEAPHRLVRGGGEATERVLAVLRAQVVTFAEEVAAGALLEELAAKVVDAALEELPSKAEPSVEHLEETAHRGVWQLLAEHVSTLPPDELVPVVTDLVKAGHHMAKGKLDPFAAKVLRHIDQIAKNFDKGLKKSEGT